MELRSSCALAIDQTLALLNISSYCSLYTLPDPWADAVMAALEEGQSIGFVWPVNQQRFAAVFPVPSGACARLDADRRRLPEVLLGGPIGAGGLRRLPRGYTYPTLFTCLPSPCGDDSRSPASGCRSAKWW